MIAGVIGGGAFGTAMAIHLAKKGMQVKMWVMEDNVREAINTEHENTTFLPGFQLDEKISAVADMKELGDCEMALFVIPTPFLRSFIVANRESIPVGVPLAALSKGIENETLLTPHEILEDELPGKYHRWLAVISGPSFAAEVAKGKPTSVSCASRDVEVARKFQKCMSTQTFRVYTGTDVMGCEICGAVKNVLAIAAGASDGFDFGSNGRAALITRGLAEITRLAVKKGADPATMAGLAGVGDLVLTTSSSQSRNFTVGYRMAKGETLDEIISSMKMVAEGVKTARSVHYMAQSLEVDMPICEQVYEVLYNQKPILEALSSLQHRPLRDELDNYDT